MEEDDKLRDELSKVFGEDNEDPPINLDDHMLWSRPSGFQDEENPPITADDHMQRVINSSVGKVMQPYFEMHHPMNMAKMQATMFERKAITFDLDNPHDLGELNKYFAEEWTIESRFENRTTTQIVVVISRLKKELK